VKAVIDIETEKFNEIMKRWLVTTTRELSVAVNARMAFLLMRMFVLIPPHRVQQKRDEIRTYLNQPIGDRRMDKKTGKKVGKARMLRRVHLIAQARAKGTGKQGLYGETMAKAAISPSSADPRRSPKGSRFQATPRSCALCANTAV